MNAGTGGLDCRRRFATTIVVVSFEDQRAGERRLFSAQFEPQKRLARIVGQLSKFHGFKTAPTARATRRRPQYPEGSAAVAAS